MNEVDPEQPRDLPATQTNVPTVPRWEDLIDIFLCPREVFQRRAEGSLFIPLATLAGLGFFSYYFFLPANAMMLHTVLAERAALASTPDQAETLLGLTSLFTWGLGIVLALRLVVVVLGTGFLLWIVAHALRSPTRLSRVLVVATYAAFVQLLSHLSNNLYLIWHGEAGLDSVRDASFGILHFVGDHRMEPIWRSLGSRLDLFAVWQAILWGIDLMVVLEMSRTRATVIAALTWALVPLPAVLGWVLR